MSNPFITKVFHFNAAHQYGHDDWSAEKNWEVFGLDSKVHGHNYTLEVMVTAAINPDTGFIVDLGELKSIYLSYYGRTNILQYTFITLRPPGNTDGSAMVNHHMGQLHPIPLIEYFHQF